MKKLSLLVLTIAFVFTVSAAEVYAATTTITAAGTGATADIAIANTPTFSKQTAVVSFTTSSNVYVAFDVSATPSAEYFTVAAGHLNGDKEYAMGNSGGTMYYRTRTPGTASIYAPPTISTAGAMTTTGWTPQ